MFKNLIHKLREKLNTSTLVHARKKNVGNLNDLVDLIDRFINGNVRYELEWDDFISWKHENAYVESVRSKFELNESLLFSKSSLDRKKYISILLEERNKLASVLAIKPYEIEEQ